MSAYLWTIDWANREHVRKLELPESASTNTTAKEQFQSLGHRSLVITNHQTGGRGRGNHTWTDSAGQALLSSWIFQTEKSPQPILSALIGLALFESASKTWPEIAWALRAPNDLYVIASAAAGHSPISKKIAGILIELVSSSPQTSVVVGLGMNVASAPPATSPYPATSLADELSALGAKLTESDWGRFLTTWLATCETYLRDGVAPELKQSARDALRAGLALHPEYRDIKTVEPDGSLTFASGRKISWSDL